MNRDSVRVRRRIPAVALTSLFVAVFTTLSGQSADAGVQRPAVSLVSQSSFVSGVEGSSFQISLQLSPAIIGAVTSEANLVLTAHRPVASRADVRSAIEGDLPQIIDAVRFSLGDLLTSSDAATGRVDLFVRTEIGTRTPEALQMSATGTYPLAIDIEMSGERISRLVSFIERLAPDEFVPSSTNPVSLALVGRISAPISLVPDSTTVISPATRTSMTDWAALLESRPSLAMTIALRPELVDAFGRADAQDRDVLIRFQRAAAFEAISSTFVEMDPTDADRHGLADIFTRQLRLGEGTLASLFPSLVTPRHSWLLSDPLSTGGARILADLGFRTVVMPVNSALSSIDTDVDPRRFVELSFSDDGAITGVLTDSDLASTLERGSFRPEGGEHLVAHQLLADLKMMSAESPSDTPSALVLTTPSGDMPSPHMTEALIDTISRDPRFAFTTLEDALTRMGGKGSGERIALSDLLDQPPEHPASADLGPVIAGLDATIDSFASALSDGDERVRTWRRLIDVVADNRLEADARSRYIDSIRAGTDSVAASIVPPSSTTFTLGGRDSPIRFSIRNDGTSDVDVLVRLRSSKLRLPEGDKRVTLLAGASTAVEFAVSARTNGRFPVSLQLLTPDGQVLLGSPSTLTARVNALAGLGQLVTGIALLFLASWWVNHLRRQYRRRQTDTDSSAQRHPSGDRTADDQPYSDTADADRHV